MELNPLKIKFHLCRVNNSSFINYILSINNGYIIYNVAPNIFFRIEFKCRNRKK